MKKLGILMFACMISLTFLSGLTFGAYPTKPVVLVTHSSAGAGGDIFLRNLVKHLEPYTKSSMVVENRAGGGGAIALNRHRIKHYRNCGEAASEGGEHIVQNGAGRRGDDADAPR